MSHPPSRIVLLVLWIGSSCSLFASGFLIAGASNSLPPSLQRISSTFGVKPSGATMQEATASLDTSIPIAKDEVTQKWDVDRYQSSHSFVWKYGTSLLDLIDVDSLVALASSPSDLQGSSSCAGPAPTALRALDLGCGTGHLTKQLRDKIFASANAGSDGVCRDVQVLGMDLDPAMIESAKSSFPSIDFFVGDARSFRLKDRHKLLEASPPSPPKSSSSAQVHLILSNAALHWVPPRDVDRAVESISRTLVPGGQFVAEFGGKGNVGAIVRALQRVFPPAAPSSAPDFWYYPSIAGFSTVLERHGIEVTSASLYDRPTPLEDGDDGMKNWIKMFGSKFWEHYRDLSEDQLEAKIDEAVELLRPDLYDPATRQWTADYRRIRVVGRKL